jgi:hypothetical protein
MSFYLLTDDSDEDKETRATKVKIMMEDGPKEKREGKGGGKVWLG